MKHNSIPQAAGPVAWLFKLLVLLGKFFYFFVRILIWILRRLRPRR